MLCALNDGKEAAGAVGCPRLATPHRSFGAFSGQSATVLPNHWRGDSSEKALKDETREYFRKYSELGGGIWCAWPGSNQQPTASEAVALSN